MPLLVERLERVMRERRVGSQVERMESFLKSGVRVGRVATRMEKENSRDTVVVREREGLISKVAVKGLSGWWRGGEKGGGYRQEKRRFSGSGRERTPDFDSGGVVAVAGLRGVVQDVLSYDCDSADADRGIIVLAACFS